MFSPAPPQSVPLSRKPRRRRRCRSARSLIQPGRSRKHGRSWRRKTTMPGWWIVGTRGRAGRCASAVPSPTSPGTKRCGASRSTAGWHPGYVVDLRVQKRVKEVFGWSKLSASYGGPISSAAWCASAPLSPPPPPGISHDTEGAGMPTGRPPACAVSWAMADDMWTSRCAWNAGRMAVHRASRPSDSDRCHTMKVALRSYDGQPIRCGNRNLPS